MGIRLKRTKEKKFLLRFFYLINRFPVKEELKLRLYLNLEWIFERLSHEMSFRVFSHKNHPLRNFTKSFVLDNIRPEHKVLDLGCKNGELSYTIATKAEKVIGVDTDKISIANAKKRFAKDNLIFINVDAYEYLNNNNESFDVLILSHILEHLDNPENFVKKYSKYFKYIYIELPDFDKSYLNHYRKSLNMGLIYTDEDHIAEFDRQEIIDLIKSCNLEVLRSEFRFGIQKIWCKVL